MTNEEQVMGKLGRINRKETKNNNEKWMNEVERTCQM